MVTVREPDSGSTARAATPEQSRARYPDASGSVERDGVRVFWERYGDGDPTILFVPTWSLVTSRFWKAQIPDFARRHRVVTFDARGNGRSDRPPLLDAYSERAMALDILAVMDETGLERAVLVSLSLGAQRALIVGAEHPDRVAGLVFIAPSVPIGRPPPDRTIEFDNRLASTEGWARYNRHYWRRDYTGFLEFFFGRCLTEPHSTKQIEDAIGWGHETDAETLILTTAAAGLDEAETRALAAAVLCPTLVIQGDRDAVSGPGRGVALTEAIPGARLELIAGGGHFPPTRDPVRVNLLIRDFMDRLE
jgi:pimeloyl-ACP methyl ester carboxylesterase